MSAADECMHSSFLIQPVQGGLSLLSAPPLNSHGPYRLLGVPIMSSSPAVKALLKASAIACWIQFLYKAQFCLQGSWQDPFGDIFGCLSFSGSTCATSLDFYLDFYNTPHNVWRAATTKNYWAPNISSAKIGKNLIYPCLETYSAADFHLS